MFHYSLVNNPLSKVFPKLEMNDKNNQNSKLTRTKKLPTAYHHHDFRNDLLL